MKLKIIDPTKVTWKSPLDFDFVLQLIYSKKFFIFYLLSEALPTNHYLHLTYM